MCINELQYLKLALHYEGTLLYDKRIHSVFPESGIGRERTVAIPDSACPQ